MSSLNQAFIKAYQRRGAAAPHMPLPPVSRANDVAIEIAAPAQPPLGEVRAFDRQEAAVPPSHLFRKSPLSAPLVSRYAADDVPPLEQPVPAAVAALDITPACSADHANKRDELASECKFGGELEPAYEVERFEWPAVVTSLAGEAAAELSDLIHELLPDRRGTLLVTGCRRGEGRTSIALLIARHLARSGQRVLAIDADVERPYLAASLATDAELGWNEILNGGSPEQAMIESLRDRLVILPLRKAMDGATQAATILNDMGGELSHKFDVLCIDTGPLVEGGADRIHFGHTPLTAAIVVRDVRHSRLEQSHAVGRKFVKLGVSRWAIIENFV